MTTLLSDMRRGWENAVPTRRVLAAAAVPIMLVCTVIIALAGPVLGSLMLFTQLALGAVSLSALRHIVRPQGRHNAEASLRNGFSALALSALLLTVLQLWVVPVLSRPADASILVAFWILPVTIFLLIVALIWNSIVLLAETTKSHKP